MKGIKGNVTLAFQKAKNFSEHVCGRNGQHKTFYAIQLQQILMITLSEQLHEKNPAPPCPAALTAEQTASEGRHSRTQQAGDRDTEQQLQGLLSQRRALLWNQRAKGQWQNKFLQSIWGVSTSVRGHACPQGRDALCPLLPRVILAALCLGKLIMGSGTSLLLIPWDFKTGNQMRHVTR